MALTTASSTGLYSDDDASMDWKLCELLAKVYGYRLDFPVEMRSRANRSSTERTTSAALICWPPFVSQPFSCALTFALGTAYRFNAVGAVLVPVPESHDFRTPQSV